MDALYDIFDDLMRREPVFHRPEFPTVMAEDYFEIGASGQRYDRAFILRHLTANKPVDAAEAGWEMTQPELRPVGADVFLLTYTLHQQERVTRRATVWQRAKDGWQILYHQGTVVS